MTISGKKDETKLRILADRQTYKVGEEASVNLYSRGRAGIAVLAWEADRILSYKLVDLRDGDNRVAWVVDGPQFPNFTLTAARMAGTAFDEAKLDIKVERDLRVTVAPLKATVGPDDEVEVDITTVDQLGRPVAAEVSLALVDRSLLRLYGDKLPNIGTYFYDQTRTGAFATKATNTFKYEPSSTPVSEAVYISTIANGGTRVTPHLLKAVDDGSGWKPAPPPAPQSVVTLRPETMQAIRDGLWSVVNDVGGTGGKAKLAGYNVVGKTGTAQVISLEGAKAANEITCVSPPMRCCHSARSRRWTSAARTPRSLAWGGRPIMKA